MFALLLFGLLFHEITYPIAVFLSQHKIPFLFIFLVGFLGYAVAYGKKRNSVAQGIGVFFAYSQFWFFVLSGVMGIAESVAAETDPVLSAFIGIVVGALVGGYGLFNYKMLSAARADAENNPWYFIVVGILGWVINLLVA